MFALLAHNKALTPVAPLVESEPIPELVAQLSQEVYNTDLLPLLVSNIAKFEFEVQSHEICKPLRSQ